MKTRLLISLLLFAGVCHAQLAPTDMWLQMAAAAYSTPPSAPPAEWFTPTNGQSLYGVVAVDRSGNSRHATGDVASVYSTERTPAGALRIFGDNSPLLAPGTYLDGVTSFTWSVWMRRNSGKNIGLTRRYSAGFRLFLSPVIDGSVYFGSVSPDGNWYGHATGTPNDTNWHQYVMRFNGGAADNGTRLVLSIDATNRSATYEGAVPAVSISLTNTALIGVDIDSGNNDGGVSDIAITLSPETDSWVTNLYLATHPGSYQTNWWTNVPNAQAIYDDLWSTNAP